MYKVLINVLIYALINVLIYALIKVLINALMLMCSLICTFVRKCCITVIVASL